jgi:hypothetical protein
MLPPRHSGIGYSATRPRQPSSASSPSLVARGAETNLFPGFRHSIPTDLFFAGYSRSEKKHANSAKAFSDPGGSFISSQEYEADSELPTVLKADSKDARVKKQRAATQDSTAHSNRFQRDSRHKRSAPPHRGRIREDRFKTLAEVAIPELRQAQTTRSDRNAPFHSADSLNSTNRSTRAPLGYPTFSPESQFRNLLMQDDALLFDKLEPDEVLESVERVDGAGEGPDLILFNDDDRMAFDSETDFQEVKAPPPPLMDGAIGLYGMQDALTTALDADLEEHSERQARRERSTGLSPSPLPHGKPS